MGKVDAQMQARMDGMAYALKIAKERGIDGLENDIKARGILGVNLSVSDKEFQEAFEKMCTMLFWNMKTVMMQVLIEKFGFGEKRLKKVQEAYDEKVDYLFDFDKYGEHFVTFEDMAKELREKYDIDVSVDAVKENQESFDERHNLRILPNIIKLLEMEGEESAVEVLKKHLHEEVCKC